MVRIDEAIQSVHLMVPETMSVSLLHTIATDGIHCIFDTLSSVNLSSLCWVCCIVPSASLMLDKVFNEESDRVFAVIVEFS